MDSLQATYKEDEDDEEPTKELHSPPSPSATTAAAVTTTIVEHPEQNDTAEKPQNETEQQLQNDTDTSQNGDSIKQQEDQFISESDPTTSNDTEKPTPKSRPKEDNEEEEEEENEEDDDDDDDDDEEDPPPKKQKHLSSLTLQLPQQQQQEPATIDNNVLNETKATPMATTTTAQAAAATKKKSKKKSNNNVWVTRSTRKGKKKTKANTQNTPAEDTVLITPVLSRLHDKTDDTPDMAICLSKVYKAEKVELSEDRLSAGSTKGYRMVRATRGVCEGACYFEIKVVNLGETGHTRLGWSTEKGDLQAPVGYDANSFGYRDIDGSKVHKALREKYGDGGYKEGDVIGFYINLPDGSLYAPKPPHLVWYKGQRYVCAPDFKEDPPKIIPGSEISFFKNGICQGVAFKDLYGGRYYPAASMYTLPNQPNCVVKFNFGPNFELFPVDFGGRPIPRPMVEVPYHGFDHRVENGVSNEDKH